jgi:cell division protein FtsQ
MFVYAFSQSKNLKKNITNIQVELTQENDNLLNQSMVNKLLIEKFNNIKKVQKHVLDLNNLEKFLDKHPMIEKSNVYLNIKGELVAKVYDKKPLARVLVKNGTRYIDKNGDFIPLSENFSARVPFCSGQMQNIKNKDFLSLLERIDEDDFFKQSIINVVINNKGEVTLYQRGQDYEIDFGKPNFIEVKLSNFKSFYQFNATKNKINNYNRITLRYVKQVICSKTENDEQ